ncbi:family 16 glycosylhydrolase [Actinoplanes sp. NPDC049548]|uniref:RICIN domain-containing protein n=1 Tax=Actinoplanes sp. NPDC049548 TaxID=3155152 RepID=UPI003413B141
MRSSRILVATLAVAAALGGSLYAASRHDSAGAATTRLTWQDEFNAPAGTPADATKWTMETGEPGAANKERQWYTTSTSNAAHDGTGNMVITARKENPGGYQCWYGTCQYTSARLITAGKFTQAYGRFEARIKVPGGQGIWPAFWMLGDNLDTAGWPGSGEIDILEHVGAPAPNTVYGTIHGPGYSGAGGIQSSKVLSAPVSDAFHVFSVDWTPNLIVWQVDGVEYHRATPASIGANTWVFDHPFSLLLNLAVGGSWPGDPDASTTFPRQLLIDYVRAYEYTGEATPSPSATTAAPTTAPAPSASASASASATAPASAPASASAPAGTVSLRSALSRRCVDLPAGNTADGTRLQLWTCTGQSPQKWTFTADGTLRALGKCMDPAGGALGNGTPIQLVTCNGNPVQRFGLSPTGTLVNASSGRCVDVTDANRANGAALQLWDCAGTANQRWVTAGR